MTNLGKKGATAKRAILEAAHLAFVHFGYEIGVRDIAKLAGVSPMAINRYYGSKENLFEEVVDWALSAPGIITPEVLENSPDADTLCQEITKALVETTTPNVIPMDGFLIMLRSAGNKRAAEILREKIETYFSQPLAKLLPEVNSTQRSALFLAVIAGFQMTRQVIKLQALTEAEPSDLTNALNALFQVLITENPPGK
jgi:AcrR family transcriptional regulator